MALWIVLTVLTSAAAILVAAPFIRRLDGAAANPDQAITVYKDQLAELAREREQGLLDEQSATLAQTEIERRILASAEAASASANDIPPRMRAIALIAIAGLVVIGSTGLYAVTGKPDLPVAPFVAQPVAAELSPVDELRQRLATGTIGAGSGRAQADAGDEAEDLIANLAARLQKNPDDAAGWRMLGWSYFNTQRHDKAAEAYAHAVALQGDDAAMQSAYGETLVRAADGFVTEAALKVFEKTLALDEKDARARFFKGLALEQAGKPSAAIDAWIAILNEAPQNAIWIEDLRQRVDELAAASSIDISGRLAAVRAPPLASSAAPEKAPTAEDVRAAQAMPAEDRAAMIRGMVDQLASRLDDNPDDADGWIKLMRSRLVLGERDAAVNALRRANEVFSDVPETRARIAAAAAELGISGN